MKKASSRSLQKCDQLELSILLLIEAWKKEAVSEGKLQTYTFYIPLSHDKQQNKADW